ncbi:MAG: tetraacyldisaccharide 4'-kinase [Proteobacteria bacterium]|nr:tetraacyldisaccharide 4'-kinase [Pseudomonadota bacterium]
MDWLVSSWYRKSVIRFLLLPITVLFCTLVRVRRFFYKQGLLRTHWFPFPIIIVGNITVGGTGKTPLVVKLIKQLQQAGYRPGIVSRGYGAKAEQYPIVVSDDSLASEVGDEALLLYRCCQCPTVIDPVRPRAVSKLLRSDCDIVVSDDGLQHYALGRDIEIIVVDGERGLGNGLCLPAGPLREPPSRLNDADIIVTTGGNAQDNTWAMTLEPDCFVNVFDLSQTLELSAFSGNQVHAVAGIGNPNRFFKSLNKLGCAVTSHAFADHYAYCEQDLVFTDDLPVIMTEKDAVKYEMAGANLSEQTRQRYWFLRVESKFVDEDGFENKLRSLLEEK